MTMATRQWRICCLAILAMSVAVCAAEIEPKSKPLLNKGGRVVIVGDSITEAMCYSRFLELYFTACLPEMELSSMHVGRSGATVGAMTVWNPLLILPYKPTLVTTCFGMNDGGYVESSPAIAKAYSDSLKSVIGTLKETGITVLVGSPGVVDTRYFTGLRSPHKPGEAAVTYNRTLSGLRDAARDVAAASQMPFADIHAPMFSVMEKAKAALGNEYPIATDGIHPHPNGHLVMAYAFLMAMGVDGNLGGITVDMDGTATASDGHRVVSFDKGIVQLESVRYPFCFNFDDKSPSNVRSILPFVPFNQELNRFMLTVKNMKAERAKVSWGAASRTFTRRELEAGINLADAFAGETPFQVNFKKADDAVMEKEIYETKIRTVLGEIANLLKKPADQAKIETLREILLEGLDRKSAEIRAILAPVKHSLAITLE